MKNRANDILTDYEGLCGELHDILTVLDLASTEEGPNVIPMLNTANHALRYLIADHTSLTEEYRKEI